jgi:hypothetical protein
VERFIHNQNLKLYRQKLADPNTGDAERETVRALLAEEEAREVPFPPLPEASIRNLQRYIDPPALLQYLVIAERQISDAEVDVVRQENLITRMELDGKDTIEPKALLITMRATLALHQQARRRILDLLDQ